MMEQYLRRKDVCKMLGIHRNTFSIWVRTGKLKSILFNKRRYVPESEIYQLLWLQYMIEEKKCSNEIVL